MKGAVFRKKMEHVFLVEDFVYISESLVEEMLFFHVFKLNK